MTSRESKRTTSRRGKTTRRRKIRRESRMMTIRMTTNQRSIPTRELMNGVTSATRSTSLCLLQRSKLEAELPHLATTNLRMMIERTGSTRLASAMRKRTRRRSDRMMMRRMRMTTKLRLRRNVTSALPCAQKDSSMRLARDKIRLLGSLRPAACQ